MNALRITTPGLRTPGPDRAATDRRSDMVAEIAWHTCVRRAKHSYIMEPGVVMRNAFTMREFPRLLYKVCPELALEAFSGGRIPNFYAAS
jgi:hypothetical protein